MERKQGKLCKKLKRFFLKTHEGVFRAPKTRVEKALSEKRVQI